MSRDISHVEARGLGANDVVLIEKIFHRVMSEGPARGAGGRLRNSSNNNNNHYAKQRSNNTSSVRDSTTSSRPTSNGTSKSNAVDSNNNLHARHAQSTVGYSRSSPPSPPLGGLVGLYVSPGMVSGGNTENQAPAYRYHQRSAGPLTKRQIARDCGLKSLPVSSRQWTPAGRSNLLLDLADQTSTSPHQSQIYLQAPECNVKPRRGLSGSKIQQSPPTPRTGRSLTPRAVSVPGSDQSVTDHHHHQNPHHHHQYQQHYNYHHPVTETVGYPVAPSPRPQSKRFNTRRLSAPSEEEDESGLVRCYRWNESEQGLRLQRQISSLTSCRSMKRASEMVSHRLDPMYMMNGSKMLLQNRYCIDDTEMQRLHEMTQIREGLMSDLKKMKFPYGARASKHVVRTLKHRPVVEDTPRPTDDQAQHAQSSNVPVHPSTPASDPAGNHVTHEEQEPRPPSVHSDDESSHAATD